jgi:hypothetical protein
LKALVLTTGTPDTFKLVGSFEALGHPTDVVRYDVCPKNGPNHIDIVHEVRSRAPDIVIYIGAIKSIHHSWVPGTGELVAANKIAPMVHICSDAADPPWWADLEEYDRERAFELQVSIDGSVENPLAGLARGMLALTPLDAALFAHNGAWLDRPVLCGFAGGVGFRENILGPLRQRDMLTHYGGGGHAGPYPELCRFYTTCKSVVNDCRTGSGTRTHVKGRFVEAAMGGALVLEQLGSPADKWFESGKDFLVYHGIDELLGFVDAIKGGADYTAMAQRLESRMRNEHSGAVFWSRVLARMGLA